MTLTHLRYLGGRRIGGIIIAFTDASRRDAYNNYWTVDTDLCLQRYSVRPLYYQHNGAMVEAGLIRSEDLVITSDGLYIEVDLAENEAGDACLRLVQAGRAFYSTGVMPRSWIERADGWVQRWPWVEASVTDHPATRDGLTRASIVRSFDSEFTGDGDEFLRRGPVFPKINVWSDGEFVTPNGAPSHPVVQTPAPVDGPALSVYPPVERDGRQYWNVTPADIAAIVRNEIQAAQPARQLPPAPLPSALMPTPPAAAPQPQIEVRHAYDDLTLAGLALWGHLRMQAGRMQGEARNPFFRALQAKVSKQLARDEAITDEQLMRGAIRMVDNQVATDWGRHIRANEAMTSTYTNYGDELVPTLLSSVLWYHFMLEAQVLNALQKIQLPSQPYEYPIVTGGPVIRRIPQLVNQANFSVHASVLPATKISTDKVTFSVGEIGALVLAEQTLFEDSAIGVANMWANQMMRQMGKAIDYVILNGDESADVNNISHLGVDPTGTEYDKILILDGLRHMAYGNSDTVAQVTIDANSAVALRALMGPRGNFGLNPKSLINIVDPNVYYDLLGLAAIESIADVGSQATLLTGSVGQIKGVPVLVSDELENTDATGKFPSAHNGTKASHVVVNTNNVVVGYRREISTELAKIPGTGGYFADISVRFDVQEMEAGQVALGFNTTV